jgi:hypothetical protein
VSIKEVLQWYSIVDTIPEKIIVDDIGDQRFYSYFSQEYLANSNRLVKRKWDGFFSDPPHDCIYQITYKSKNPGNGDIYFVEGVGGPFWNHEYFPGNDFLQLLYFNVNGEEWGNPLDCDSLLFGIPNVVIAKQPMKIIPNPMSEQTRIKYDNPNHVSFTLYFYNMFGEKIKEWKTRSNEILINKESLVPGIYLLKLYREGLYIQMGKLIVE